MSQLPCPEWKNEQEPFDKLPGIVIAAKAIYDFILRQNHKRYLLNHGHLKEWHGKLFQGVVPVPYYAGHYRSPDERYPCLNVDNEVDGVSGTPVEDVAESMARFSDELENATTYTDAFVTGSEAPELRVKAAAQLAAFAAGNIIQIHPFINGNGRTARLTANFFFNRYGFQMPFYISRPTPSELGAEYASASASAMLGDFSYLFRYFIVLMAR